MQGLHHAIRNLVRDERGNIAMTFGLTSLIAVAAVGGSIDYGRTISEKTKMQMALDAAVISGIAKYREAGDWSQAQATASSTFIGVFNNADVMPANLTQQQREQRVAAAPREQPVVNFSQSGTTMTGTANMKVNTPFMRLVINDDLRTGVTSTGAPPSGKQLEVAVMVDLTGSMGWQAAPSNTSLPCSTVSNPDSKIDYLKCAGEDLLNILLPSNGANTNSVKIGIAPFSDKVNAGQYASAVTGLNANGGAFANVTNLASTKQGSFTGTYSGSSATGSQFGAQGYYTTSGSTATGAGATFTNSYCATTTAPSWIHMSGTSKVGESVWLDGNNNDQYSGPAPAGMLRADQHPYYDIANYNFGWHLNNSPSSSNHSYYVPLLSTAATGLTKQTRTADVWVSTGRRSGYNRSTTGNVGQAVNYNNGTVPANLLAASSSPGGGYWHVDEIKENGSLSYEWRTDGHYIPMYTAASLASALSAGGTTAGCEAAEVVQPSSKLITCVTERKNGTALDYTADVISAGRYVGPYNHGNASKSNYSSDGKCWTAGRELPAVIPLTNDRETLTNFFSSATVGGATAGHLGTAWASYLLSPNWGNIWPSQPAAYNTKTTKKAAILMTDGEYNIQFFTGTTGATSAKQALELCKQMRDNGIHVYTVGFGFAANAAPPTSNVEGMSATERVTPLTAGTAQQKALDTLAKCASNNSSYKFPYDGESLRQAFKDIGNGLATDLQGGTARLTN